MKIWRNNMHRLRALWVWIVDHPFRASVVVMLLIVTPGFVRIEQTAMTSRDAAEQAKISADLVQQQADRNSEIIGCLTQWVSELTDSLQDRDVVAKTARAAQKEMWDSIYEWLDTQPAGADRTDMLIAIKRFRNIISRLERTAAINPYPEIRPCLSDIDIEGVYQLVALQKLHPGVVCSGRSVTIRGSRNDDVIHGTDVKDVIKGFRGRDIIHGGRGRDIICGGRGGDTINGGQGHDHGRGQAGDDFCIQVETPRSC